MVNFGFISELEGGQVLQGYVPDAGNSKSGVTIATGFDLGQYSISQLQMAFSHDLYRKIYRFIGLKGQAALTELDKSPLTITRDEADDLDAFSHSKTVEHLSREYLRDSGVSFESLPDEAQTVLASVAFQYGNVDTRCPKFWCACIKQDWSQAIAELRNFGDRYPTRRNKEADYLEVVCA